MGAGAGNAPSRSGRRSDSGVVAGAGRRGSQSRPGHQLKGFLLRHDVRYQGKTSWCGVYYRWLGTLNFGAGAAQTAKATRDRGCQGRLSSACSDEGQAEAFAQQAPGFRCVSKSSG